MSNRDQLMDAYGDSVYVDDRTIDSHIKRIRRKCVVDGVNEIETCRIGYRYPRKAAGLTEAPMTTRHSSGGPPAAGAAGILSRLTLRILAINLFAVAILFVGVLYLDRYQNSLIRAELEAIDRQGRVFAQAVGELAIPSALSGPSRLSPPALRRLVRRLAPALDMRVRIFAPGGRLLVDSAVLPGPGGFIRMHPLPPPRDGGVVAQMLFDMARRMADWLPRRGDMPPYRERAEQWADDYLEVRLALAGETAQQVRLTSDGTFC